MFLNLVVRGINVDRNMNDGFEVERVKEKARMRGFEVKRAA